MGLSESKSISTQKANVNILQQFSGTCNVTCENSMENVNVDIINSTIGGNIEIDQTCATNASCLIGSNMDAIADIYFKAANSTNAKDAGLGSSGDIAISKSRQDIKENIQQISNEKCNISSYNQMDNISIFAANSTIGGNISISQNASTQGQCKLTNNMTAAAYATGIANNQATSGKDKKGEKKGDKSSIMTGIVYVILAIVVIVIVFIIGKIISSHSQSTEEKAQTMRIAMARARAGCPGGTKPVIDPKTGIPIIDPKTMRPICPPPPIPAPPTKV